MLYFVFDIETIRDNALLSVSGSDRDKEKAEAGEFLNPIFHKPICFSFMTFTEDKLKSFKSYVGKEKEIATLFWQIVNEVVHTKPTFVTFNGKRFDFPVMLMRGIKFLGADFQGAIREYLNDSDKWENHQPNYTNRFTKYHIDLIEVFGTKASLHSFCSLYGIPVKTEAHGSDVEKLYAEGQYERIARYCAEDVLATSKLLRVFLLAKTGNSFPFLLEKLEPQIAIL